jgi:2-methylcitrate dehydratase PrpD
LAWQRPPELFFNDGRVDVERNVLVEYPVGHPRRRAEGIPLLRAKAERNLARRSQSARVRAVLALFSDASRFDAPGASIRGHADPRDCLVTVQRHR